MGLPVLNEMVYFMGTLRSQKVEVGRGSGDALAQPHSSGPCPTDFDCGWRLHSQARQHAPVFNPPHGRNDFMFEDCLQGQIVVLSLVLSLLALQSGSVFLTVPMGC